MWQGGKMSEEELKEFENHKYFDEIILMRMYDERAKVENMKLDELRSFKPLIDKCL